MLLAVYFFNCMVLLIAMLFFDRLLMNRVDAGALSDERRQYVHVARRSARIVVVAAFLAGAAFWMLRAVGLSTGIAAAGLVIVALAPFPVVFSRLSNAVRAMEPLQA